MKDRLYYLKMSRKEVVSDRIRTEYPFVDHNILYLRSKKFGVDITNLILDSLIDDAISEYGDLIENSGMSDSPSRVKLKLVLGEYHSHKLPLAEESLQTLNNLEDNCFTIPTYPNPIPGKQHVRDFEDFLKGKKEPVDTESDKPYTIPAWCSFDYSIFEGEAYMEIINIMKKLRRINRWSWKKWEERLNGAMKELDAACKKADLYPPAL